MPKHADGELQNEIIDFIRFEEETSLIWPWCISADEIIQNEEILQKIAQELQLNGGTGDYDVEKLYEVINQVAGINPALEGPHATINMTGSQSL